MKTVEVIFSDPQYNYITNVNGQSIDSEIRRYFVGTWFDVGVHPEENIQRCIDIKITK